MNDQWHNEWVKKAEIDLESAKKLISCDDLKDYQPSLVLLEQSLEKYLKGLFFFKKGMPIPKTHYLEELAQKLSVPETCLSICTELSEEYSSGRYPEWGSWEDDSVQHGDAIKMLERCEELIQWIKNQIN
jgi:HEPN domain-containing protein